MKRHTAHQFEVSFDAEEFCLIVETGLDQDRVDREREQKRKDKEESAAKQTAMFDLTPTKL